MKFYYQINNPDLKVIKDYLNNKINKKKIKNSKKINNITKKIKINLSDDNYNFTLIKGLTNSKQDFEKGFKILCNLFGSLVSQNSDDNKIIRVRPKINLLKKTKNKKKNLRYHETNLGGSYHSDGPQLSNSPFLLLMGCENNSKSGGESVVVNVLNIFKFLKKNKKNYFKKLNDFFYFEKRGFKKNNKPTVIRKKIFENNRKAFKFRYLRDYILSGYKIKNKKIEKTRLLALNYLDKLMNSKRYSETFKLGNGDVIIINNYKTAHGRKRFSLTNSSNRSILRAWVN